MTSISHAPPKTVLVVKLGVSEDYDPTFYGFYPLGTCFPTVQVHSGCLLCILTTAVAVPVTCFFRNRGAFWER